LKHIDLITNPWKYNHSYKVWSFVSDFDLLAKMIIFCKQGIEFEIQHDKTNERILNQSQTNPMAYMKKKSKNQEVGNGISWKKELEAWILKWNVLRSIGKPTT
jgi:hypothetical protein